LNSYFLANEKPVSLVNFLLNKCYCKTKDTDDCKQLHNRVEHDLNK